MFHIETSDIYLDKMEGELNYSDVLVFPEEIETVEIENVYLVVAVKTANWIVLKSTRQLDMFNLLRNGSDIGSVIDRINTDEEMHELQALLAAIFARKFAGIGDIPEISYLEGYKMLNIYVTNACNLRCKHCFMRSGNKLDKELSLHQWIGVLKEFCENGGQCVTFSGGEPLMYENFYEILKYSHEIGLTNTVLSNGTLWSENDVDRFFPYIDEIQFSLDGVDEDSNAVIRGNGKFSIVIENIIRFANRGVKTSVATTFTYDNLNEETASKYKLLVKRIQERANSEVFFKLSKKLLPGRNVNISAEENKRYAELIKSIEYEVNPHADAENFMVGHQPNLVSINCGLGGLSITADGEVCFCNRISEVDSFGNVNTKSLKEYMELGRQIHIQTSVDNVEPCSECMLRYICNGGCRIDDFNFHAKLKNATGRYVQITCTAETRQKLMKRMVDSFNYMYDFNPCTIG